MSQFDQLHTSSSPVLLLPQQMPLQHPDNTAIPASLEQSLQSRQISTPAGWPVSEPQSSITTSIIGRKRSRDESALNEDDDFLSPVATIFRPEAQQEQGWEYGEGMTLTRPHGVIVEASSQTGTWVEEKIPSPIFLPACDQDRPVIRNHKSQRLDLSADHKNTEWLDLTSSTLDAHTLKSAAMEPTVDDFTIHLGVGWSRISSDGDMQAAARGWAKYIGNHYPVNSPKIRLQSKGLASYLVESDQGWFLFSEELNQGRLVSTSLQRTFENLKVIPPIFDGAEILTAAAEAPKIGISSDNESLNDGIIGAQGVMMGKPFAQTSCGLLEETGATANDASGRVLGSEMDMS